MKQEFNISFFSCKIFAILWDRWRNIDVLIGTQEQNIRFHSIKGLEFNKLYIIYHNSNIFPHMKGFTAKSLIVSLKILQ